MSGIFQVEGIETGLRLFQRYLHFTGLQYLMGMIGRETERHTSVYNIFSQTEGKVHGTFFGFLVTDRIVVQRTGHAGHAGIVAVTILVADNFLQDDCHLFLVDDVACGLHISLAVAEINRSIYSFDGIGQHTEHFIFIIQIGNHIGIIDSGKRLIVRVLQQRRRTDGER